MDEAAWGDDDDDDDLGLDDDDDDEEEKRDGDDGAPGADDGDEDSEIFIPPTPGQDPLQAALRKNPTNAALNATAGDFLRALECLKNQIGLVNP